MTQEKRPLTVTLTIAQVVRRHREVVALRYVAATARREVYKSQRGLVRALDRLDKLTKADRVTRGGRAK